MRARTLMAGLITLAVAAAWAPLNAEACGFCAGDKAASVYSFKNKKFAEVNEARYVSLSLVMSGSAPSEEEFNRAVETLARVEGVYEDRVTSAFAQKAASIVHRSDVSFKELSERFGRAMPGWTLQMIEQIQ